MTIEQINQAIKNLPDWEAKKISDWYHTFGELYEHRHALLISLVNKSQLITTGEWPFTKSKVHFDWTSWDGLFIVQGYIRWKQISYHLPDKYRDKARCKIKDIADERDGHTSQDVIDRLLSI